MAKSNAVNVKTIGKGFSNELQYYNLIYDASVDSVTFNDQIVIGILGNDMLIHEAHVWVETAVESLGAATMKIGDTDDAETFMTDTAKANLTADSVHNETTGQGKHLASGKEIIVAPLIADLTAGKVHVKLTCSNA